MFDNKDYKTVKPDSVQDFDAQCIQYIIIIFVSRKIRIKNAF